MDFFGGIHVISSLDWKIVQDFLMNKNMDNHNHIDIALCVMRNYFISYMIHFAFSFVLRSCHSFNKAFDKR